MSITEPRAAQRLEGQGERGLHDYVFEAIHNGGYGRVIDEPRTYPDQTALLAVVCALSIYVGYAFVAGQLGLSWPWAMVAGTLATCLAVLAGAEALRREDDDTVGDALVWMILLSVIAGAAFEGIAAGWEVLLSHALPIAAGVLLIATAHRFEASTVRRTLGVGKKVIVDIPLLFPVLALVTFTLILNAEVWLVGAAQSPLELAVLGTITIVPLVALLASQLVRSIKEVVDGTIAMIKLEPPWKEFKAAVKGLAGRRAGKWVKSNARGAVHAACAEMDSREVAKHVCERLSPTFKRRIVTRLGLSVVAVAVAAFLIIYGLTWLMVDETTAVEWTRTGVVDYWVVAGVSVPLGPYPRVAAMLAIILTSIFVSLVLTTKDLRDGFRKAYVETPASTAVVLVVVYRWAIRT